MIENELMMLFRVEQGSCAPEQVLGEYWYLDDLGWRLWALRVPIAEPIYHLILVCLCCWPVVKNKEAVSPG